MRKNIFANEANKFWERGFSVVPIKFRTKRPPMEGWQGNLSALPNDLKRKEWLAKYADHGIGLLLGHRVNPDWVLVALDLDDDRHINLALHYLGLNPEICRAVLSGKSGKKGKTIFALAPHDLKSTVLKGGGGLGNIDFLAAGKMTVMPPSIHPETDQPYTIAGVSILDVDLETLPRLTERDINILKAAIGSEHAVTLISGTATHDAGVSLAAILVRSGATDDEVQSIFAGLLPANYEGNSLKELPEWLASARKNGFETSAQQNQNETIASRLVSLARRKVELFHDRDGTAFATFSNDAVAETLPVKSSRFGSWLRGEAFKQLEKPVGTGPLYEAIATLETLAIYDGPLKTVYSRVAGDHIRIEIDRGVSDEGIVSITGEGWHFTHTSTFKFIRGSGFSVVPAATRGGDIYRLQRLLGLDEQGFYLLLGFLLNALRPTGPYFILLIEGEQGSGKSLFAHIVKMMIDPNRASRLRLPDNDRDLMIHAKEFWLLNFDNASGMKADMSDALCVLATGGGIAVRKLYTDGELHVMSFARPFVINGISGYANRPDLLERGIPIRLQPMGHTSRKTEGELLAELKDIMPEVLGVLYDAVSSALNNLANTEPPRNLRMADAAQWLMAAEPALKLSPGTLVQAIVDAQDDVFVDRINNDSLVIKLRQLTSNQPFEGYIGDLFAEIDAANDPNLPKTPAHLSSHLTRLRPAMAKAGISVEFLEKDRRGRKVRITSEALEGAEKPRRF
ncbi:hypothetical protein GCM10011491_19030 [Brucella endophytica]|uniref:DNA primase/polymerase bifunctional N-terminal domain-containing protein n=1 Tax=Brucella endophytica TaxID=1963359 RepID=A0A916SAI6_9HYPH|nr:bifunctional DNA primase/polymerase [Brucella endophytica]GGA91221.1 hypothetical protein GCM10011491_19030 [Brucella endophytica]